MKKLLAWLDSSILKWLAGFLIAFIVLYPKLPSIGITHTWVYVRLEDFFIALTVIIFFIQTLRKKVSFPFPLGWSLVLYWIIGFVSLIYCLLFIAPHLANFFPTVAALEYFRRIEYMILFFIGFSTIKSSRDIRDYLIILGVTLFAIVVYGLGQRNYVFLWHLFPSFFEKHPFCFPAFLTGNEEFAKGTPFCLADTSRVAATFGGHYDLAAYLVFVIPVFIGIFVVVKKWSVRLATLLLVTGSLILLNYTSSRTSFAAYLIGAIAALIFWKRKWWIIPVVVLSISILLVFKGETLARFLKTIQPVNVVTVKPNQELPKDLQKIIQKTKEEEENQTPEKPPPGTITLSSPTVAKQQVPQSRTVTTVLTDQELATLSEMNVEGSISTRSGAFLVQKAYALDISFTTRFQAEWPRDFAAFMQYPVLGMGYSSLTLASDNDYLRSLGETGLVGFLSFFVIFVLFGIYLKHMGKQTSVLTQALVFGLAGGTIGLLANALLIDVFEASKVGESFWLLSGIGIGAMALESGLRVNYLGELKKLVTSSFFMMVYMLVGTFVLFGNTLTNFFVADDFTWLHWAATATLHDIPKYFLNAQGFFYRPIDKSLMFLLYTFFSFQPVGYHMVSLLLYAGTAFGLYLIALRILKSKFSGFVVAALFLLLPMHFEDVFWISTISNNILAFCIVWGAWSFLRLREKASILNYLLVILFALLSVFSYEQGVIYPLLMLAIDVLLLKRKLRKIDGVIYMPLILVDILYYVMRSLANVAPVGGDYSYSIVHFIPNVIGNFIGYMGLFIFGQSALPWYEIMRASTRHFASGIFTAGVLLLGALAVYLYRQRTVVQKLLFSPTAFTFAWIGISLLPFLPLGNIAARYGYVASLGYCILFGIVFEKVVERIPEVFPYAKKIIVGILLVSTLFLLVGQVKDENKQWQKASSITRRVFMFFFVQHPTLPQNSNLIFINVPIKQGDSWIFPVGLPDAMWFIFHDDTMKIYQLASLKQALSVKDDLTAQGKGGYIFLFKHDGSISEIKTK